ncbi:MAG: PQQ-binding-like beta-propeller repeat protein [Verrucomicrobiota bacterium]|nr:PQQ-binding-like beta-propeller repeat protein [Verrucomicrobiota bacterium]
MKPTFIALLALCLCLGGCGKTKPGTVLWEFETGGSVSSSPAIGPDGTVYVGSIDKKLYAINGKSGVKLWEFETGGYVQSSPAIGSDGTVYVGSHDKKLYAIKTDSKGLAKSLWLGSFFAQWTLIARQIVAGWDHVAGNRYWI